MRDVAKEYRVSDVALAKVCRRVHNRYVHVLHVARNRKTDTLQYEVAAKFGHGLLSPVVAYVFQTLQVSASLWEQGDEWLPIHSDRSVAEFEPEHGKEAERNPYNRRRLAEVVKRRKAVFGVHAGFSDLFVPIMVGGSVAAILVTGPFARHRPTSAEVLEHWRWLTGRQGHPADPEFAAYLNASLATLVLDGGKLASFERLLGCLAQLLAGQGVAGRLATEAERLRGELEKARFADRVWNVAATMVDDRSSRRWSGVYARAGLARLGLSRAADSLLVCLTTSRKPGIDPVDEAIGRDLFQRRCVELARARGDAISGRAGDHGVTFLCATNGTPHARKQKLLDLATHASRVARREFGLMLHCGMSQTTGEARLSEAYQAALGAAESALAQDIAIVSADGFAPRSIHSLWHLRQELGRSVQDQPAQLGPRFDRYIEVVAARSGYRIESMRAHLEVGFGQICGPLMGSGMLDERSLAKFMDDLDRAASESRTAADLFVAYRQAIADVSRAVHMPVPARHDRGLRVALDFIKQHYTEPLRRQRVARLSGFSPTYFSRLFVEREGIPFETYVLGLRLERAKQLLASTELAIVRVAELSGFNSHAYFCRAFRRAIGSTPAEYRLSPLGSRPGAHKYNLFHTKGKGTRSNRRLG